MVEIRRRTIMVDWGWKEIALGDAEGGWMKGELGVCAFCGKCKLNRDGTNTKE